MNRVHNLSRLLVLGILAAVAAQARAADQPEWKAMLGDLPKAEKAGFGGLCGVYVVHTTGAVIINISDRGFYRSTDGARTFQRISVTQPKGRTEEPGCLLL